VDPVVKDILFDPQTSGGLLISVEAESADALLKALKEKGILWSAIIGKVITEPKGKIIVK
jgi:selenide,water dikinase